MDEKGQVDINSTLTLWLSFQIVRVERCCARHEVYTTCEPWRFIRGGTYGVYGVLKGPSIARKEDL